jgi:hypothetical protein
LRPAIHVHYGGKLGRYQCYGGRANHGTARCISVSGLSMDAAIAKQVLSVLKIAARLLRLTPRQIGYALKKHGIEIKHL